MSIINIQPENETQSIKNADGESLPADMSTVIIFIELQQVRQHHQSQCIQSGVYNNVCPIRCVQSGVYNNVCPIRCVQSGVSIQSGNSILLYT